MDINSSHVDGRRPSTPKRIRGRPKKEAVERENLAQMLRSNAASDVSHRFLRKMNILQVRIQLWCSVHRLEKAQAEAQIVQL
jgi:hypothetical protein